MLEEKRYIPIRKIDTVVLNARVLARTPNLICTNYSFSEIKHSKKINNI